MIFLFSLTNSFLLSRIWKIMRISNKIIKFNEFEIKEQKEIKDINFDHQDNYNLNWYVIGEKSNFLENKLYKIKVWNKNYLVWKKNNFFYAMDDHCSHRGASLSLGHLSKSNCIICPYHGYEFTSNGILEKIPGLNFTNTNIHNQNTYNIIEQDGWIYLNIINNSKFHTIDIFREPEAFSSNFSKILFNVNFHAFSRIISENSLDIMHIGFVHTFGNKENPSPKKEIPPYKLNDYPYHYKTVYEYISGDKSIAKKIYNFKNLIIENEFILPHTTIARVIFGNYTSTVITFSLPLNETHSKLYVKTYRNFWNSKISKYIGDIITKYLMEKTVLQDKNIVENIDIKYIDGKFNMKYDKLQNVYKTFYKRLIYNNTQII